jgi:hypothetical protein
MGKRHYRQWQKEYCDTCGSEFTVTRRESMTFEDGEAVLCPTCDSWEVGYRDGAKDLEGWKKRALAAEARNAAVKKALRRLAEDHWVESVVSEFAHRGRAGAGAVARTAQQLLITVLEDMDRE